MNGLRIMYYLNEYLTNKKFGGHEEGGWWYNTGEFVRSLSTHTKLEEAEYHLKDWGPYLERKRINQFPPDSLLCSGYTQIFIEEEPGKDYPDTPPTFS